MQEVVLFMYVCYYFVVVFVSLFYGSVLHVRELSEGDIKFE